MSKDETTQEIPKMQMPFESSIRHVVLDLPSTMEIAPSAEREYKGERLRRRQQLGGDASNLRVKRKRTKSTKNLLQRRLRTARRMEIGKVQYDITECRKLTVYFIYAESA